MCAVLHIMTFMTKTLLGRMVQTLAINRKRIQKSSLYHLLNFNVHIPISKWEGLIHRKQVRQKCPFHTHQSKLKIWREIPFTFGVNYTNNTSDPEKKVLRTSVKDYTGENSLRSSFLFQVSVQNCHMPLNQ